eukprot:g20796.t1
MASWTRNTGVSSATVEPAIPSGSNRTASLAAFLLLTTALVPTAAFSGDALPQGGSFTHGNGTITQGGSRVDVKQSSDAGIVNWGSFSIGSGNQVHFDNGAGATLNRVTGNVPSRIDGNLSATGSVFLVNPAGVAVGSGGLVSTGGSFVASTQDVTDSDFLNGGGLTFSGTSGAEVVNAGTIRSAQGDIALIARRVENRGTLEAPNGTAALAAGYEVLMKDVADADGLLSVKLGGADTEALNSGPSRGPTLKSARMAAMSLRWLETRMVSSRQPNGGLTLLAYGNSGTAAVGTISTGAAGAVDVDNFTLTRGVWDQVGAGLPDFATNALSVGFGTFIRAQGGDGTFSNPYALFDVYGLQGITTHDRRGGGAGDISLYYELANDIDASTTSSWNNGAGFDPVSFSGSLDGKGHTIDGLYINRPSEGNVALISYWQDNYFTSGRDLEIKDLTLTNASVTGDNQTAILVGDTGGGNYHGHNMSNVTVSGTVQTNSWGAGVVARYFGNIDQSTMTNVHADVSVTTTDGGSATGGLVAIMGEGLTISNSSSTGSITGGQVGGLVGTTDDNDNRIENSYSTATVTSSGSFREAGGLVGYAEDLTISNSYFAGQVLGTNGAAAGGLIGTADRNTVIQNSFVTGLVEAEGYAAALVAEVSDSSVSITDSAWDTETTGQTEVIGYSAPYTATVTNTSGLTTSQMQGSLTLGSFTLDSSIWGTGSGLFPYFKWEYAATPEAVSGIVYSDAGTTAQSGANVSALSGGNLVGSAVTGANGYYYILTTAGSLNSAGALAYLDGESTKAATFADTVTSTGVSGADIWGNAFNVNTGAAATTDVVTALDTTIGAFSDTDLNFLRNTSAVVRTDQNGNSLDFNLNATSNFNLDNNLYAGGNLTVATNGTFSVGDSNAILWAHDGDLTVNGDVAWSNSNQLSLYVDASNASIKINGSVTAANGKLRVDQTSSATNVTSTATGRSFCACAWW